ncbi:MAG TPA: S9 family peptidase [Kofleriaceae bacterium]|jgi:dipeptidyl aminopeptidase/acylaminoacyl peptidase|nr:S9 family peptidase [Kofleriaceae bacterium]
MKRSFALSLLVASHASVVLAAPEPDVIADKVARMSSVGFCAAPSFSPDGASIAFVSNLTGLPQVFIVPTGGGWPVQVTSGSDPVGRPAWSPRGDLIAYTVAPGGGLNTQVHVVAPDGTGGRRLTLGGKDNNRLGVWTDDGAALTLQSNERDAASFDAYLVDVRSGRKSVFARVGGSGQLGELSRDGHRSVLTRLRSRGDSDLFLIDLAGKAEVLLTRHTPPGESSGEIAPDGRTVYLTTNNDRDRTAFGRIRIGADAKPGAFEVIAERGDAEVDDLALSHDGTTAAIVWNAAGKSQLALVDLTAAHPAITPIAVPDDIVDGVTFSRDGKRLAMSIGGAARPTDIWVLDIASRKTWQVTHSPHPGVQLAALQRPELVSFKARDGLALSGWLYRPPGVTGPAPYVVSFHGGPEGQERPVFRSDYQALLGQGIGVFAPNVRGSSGFGKAFVNLDNGERRIESLQDIKASVDFLVDQRIALAKKIGVMGGSYGGYMTMAALTEFPDLFAAGADLFGIVNFATFFAHSEPWMAAISTTEYGDPKTQKDLLDRLSPIHRVDRIKAPLIVLHGANDTNVPVVEAEQIVAALKKRGLPVEYVLFPDEGHGWRKTANRITSTVAITRFFVKYLK